MAAGARAMTHTPSSLCQGKEQRALPTRALGRCWRFSQLERLGQALCDAESHTSCEPSRRTDCGTVRLSPPQASLGCSTSSITGIALISRSGHSRRIEILPGPEPLTHIECSRLFARWSTWAVAQLHRVYGENEWPCGGQFRTLRPQRDGGHRLLLRNAASTGLGLFGTQRGR
jgi:hypothetical protein